MRFLPVFLAGAAGTTALLGAGPQTQHTLQRLRSGGAFSAVAARAGGRPSDCTALERIPFQWNRNSLCLFLSDRIFCGEPASASPENALAGVAA